MSKTKTPKPKIFTKERVANIMSAIVIMWGFVYFTSMYTSATTSDSSGSEVIAGMMGFAAKHLWDTCNK